MDGLLRLITATDNSDVKKLSRELVISRKELVDLIMIVDTGLFGDYLYSCFHKEHVPPSLMLSDEDWNSIGKSKVGVMEHDAARAFRKITQTYKDRKLASAHLIYSRCHTRWHLFTFDQRDLAKRNNHAVIGPHIHYSRHTNVNVPLNELWKKLTEDLKKPKGVHIRYLR